MRKHGRNSRDYLANIPSFFEVGERSEVGALEKLHIWAALSDRTFGGNPPRRGRGVPKVVQNNQLCKIFSF